MVDAVELVEIADIAGCRAVVDLQVEVWGRDSETVPASVLMASIRRGGLLLGALPRAAAAPLGGFVWSLPGWRDDVPTHWSHMLAVHPDLRGVRLGERLKLAQRERVLASGLDLIEWTFDPLQAQNAYLNVAVLGSIAATYLIDAYGEMRGPLHLGTPTDRLVAEWWIRTPHVERRLALRAGTSGLPLTARSAAIAEAPAVIATRTTGGWVAPAGVDTHVDARRILVPIPPRFGQMQREARELALEWRHASRAAFTTYLARAYRVVDFLRNRDEGGGAYLLSLDND
jgi:predicted GNAT superfamily acetyltransferase